MNSASPRQTYPALIAAGAVSLGIFGASLLTPSPAVRWAALGCLAVSALILSRSLIRRRDTPSVLPLVVALFLGATRYLFVAPTGESALPAGRTVTVTGEIASPPAVTGTTTRCLLRSVRITTEETLTAVEGMLLVTIRRRKGAGPALAYGQVIEARGSLARPPPRRNPGEYNLRRFYEAQGVAGLLLIRDTGTLKVLRSDGGCAVMRSVVFPFRKAVLAAIDTTVGGDEGEFLKGLLIGERGGLPVLLKEAFAVSGVAHILAVSGSNVAVVAGALFLLLAVVRCPRPLRPWILSVGLLFYMLLTGNQPPVVRATIMALLFLWSRSRNERADPYNVTGAAALLILAFDPLQLFDVGFQLSFLAVLSLVHVFPRFRALYAGVRGAVWYRRVALGALDLVALTLAATLGTLPVTAAVFGRVSVIGLLANVLVVPASGVAVLLGMTVVAASFAWSWLGAVYGETLRLLLHWTLAVVEAAGSVPFAAIDTYQFAAVDAIPYFAVLALVIHLRPPATARRLAVTCVCALALWTFLPRNIVPPFAGNVLRCTVLDVGQGDAILLQFPGGSTMLVDTGPPGGASDAGRKVIVPFLSRLGVGRIDVLVLTHGHDDHTGGLRSLVRTFPVGRILLPAESLVSLLPDRARDRFSIVSAGDSLSIGGAKVYVLAPSRAAAPSEAGAGNEASVVLKVVYGRTVILLTGDEDASHELVMASAYGDFLHADLLKVGHHGSLGASSVEFLDAVRPRYAALSVGRFNRFGHPSADVLSRLEERGILTGRTDDDGALMFEATPDTLYPLVWH